MIPTLSKAETKWRDINLEYPDSGIHFIAMTPWGERKAINDHSFFGFSFTDTNHPLQNTRLSKKDVLSWRFARKQDEDANLFHRPIIVAKAKDYTRPNFFQRLLSKLK